jgi:short-subunit dehydrogenase
LRDKGVVERVDVLVNNAGVGARTEFETHCMKDGT